MYIRHIDHRSGAPWGPHGREGGKKFSRQSREKFFPGKGPHGGAPWGPHGREGGKFFRGKAANIFFREKGPHGGPRGEKCLN